MMATFMSLAAPVGLCEAHVFMTEHTKGDSYVPRVLSL